MLKPSPVPSELKNLTSLEERLIARVCPIAKCVRLKGGQRGYKGHVINVEQKIEYIAETLPRLPSEVDLIIVKPPGKNVDGKEYTVRRHVIERST